MTRITNDKIPEILALRYIEKIKFYVNSLAIKNDNERKKMHKKIFNICKYMNMYSNPLKNKTLGQHLESLVFNELRALQFEIIGENTNEYNGIKWEKTKHNLDIIAKLKNSKLVIGVEVKNTLSVMDPKEIDVKIDICAKLGIVPVFAVRWLKPYTVCIKKQNGFAWMFKTQIHPLGSERFTKKIYEKLSVQKRGLQFPISTNTKLPIKSVKIFENWINKHKNKPLKVNSSYKCQK